MSERGRRRLLCVPALLMLAACLAHAGDDPDVAALLRAADASRLTLEEGVIRIQTTVTDKRGQVHESSLDVYVEGDDRVLCVFLDAKAKGRKILSVGERVWLLVPGTRHAIPISANQRLLGGASVADVARLRFAGDFSGTLRPKPEMVGEVPCHVVDLERRSPTAPYAGGTLWVGTEDRLPRKVRLVLPSGKEAKEIRFVAYAEDRGRTVLRRMEIDHLLPAERGTTTALAFVDYARTPVPPEAFDPVGAREFP